MFYEKAMCGYERVISPFIFCSSVSVIVLERLRHLSAMIHCGYDLHHQ